MKRLITLLLLILSLVIQGQPLPFRWATEPSSIELLTQVSYGDTTYYPQKTDDGQVLRPAAFSVVRPTGYDPTKRYAIWVNIHGVGELSEGKLANLRNVTLGFDYDGDGPEPRKYAIATPDFLAARNTYSFLAVIPTYSGELTVDQINYIFSQVEKDYSVDTSRRAIIGFSLGGKAVTRYMSSSPANAARIAVAVAVAPVNGIQSCKVVTDADLPFIGATNTTDDRVSPTNLQTVINCLRAQAPRIAPYHLIFKGNGHGGINEMLSLSHPEVPQNIYSFLQSVSNINRRAYPTNTTQPPVPPPTTGPVLKVQGLPAITTTGSVSLQGCASSSYESFTWTVISVPKGASLWAPYINGAGTCSTSAKFTIEGAYAIKATACKGSACVSDTLYTTFQKVNQPVPVVPTTYDGSTGYLVFSDGSRVQATATIDWATKKVIVKDNAGITYTW